MSKRQFIPVIHHLDIPTTLKNAKIADSVGCEYVALIQHEGKDYLLSEACLAISKSFPKLSIVVNNLSFSFYTSVLDGLLSTLDYNVKGTWVDNCGISSSRVSKDAEWVSTVVKSEQWKSYKIFGGVAFKYQEFEKHPELAAKTAYNLGFIPTTSGSETGESPSVSKTRSMAEVLPERILAVASGITPENVSDFLPYVQYYFVVTGISRDFYNFDYEKANKLQDIISQAV